MAHASTIAISSLDHLKTRLIISAIALFAATLLFIPAISSAAPKPTTVKPKTGVILVYSKGGAYNGVKLHLVNMDAKRTKCGGSFKADTGLLFHKLPISKTAGKLNPLKVVCTATSGNGQYEATFSKDTVDAAPAVTFTVDPGMCTLVHDQAAQIHKIPLVNGHCNGADTETQTTPPNTSAKPGSASTKVTKVTPSIEFAIAYAENNTKLTGTVNIFVAGQNLEQKQCSGSVSVGYQLMSSPVATVKAPALKPTTTSASLKVVSADSTHANTYCSGTFATGLLKPGHYALTATKKVSTYLLPVSANPGQADIPVPTNDKQ